MGLQRGFAAADRGRGLEPSPQKTIEERRGTRLICLMGSRLMLVVPNAPALAPRSIKSPTARSVGVGRLIRDRAAGEISQVALAPGADNPCPRAYRPY
jgi:hypothetical protein